MDIQTMPHMSLKRLAVEIGMDRSACRRYVLSLGIEPIKRRTADSGFQTALTLTHEQARQVKKARANDGYFVDSATMPTNKLAAFSSGDLLEELRRRLKTTEE